MTRLTPVRSRLRLRAVEENQVRAEITRLRETTLALFDPAARMVIEKQVEELESLSSTTEFWSTPSEAESVMADLSSKRRLLTEFDELHFAIDEAEEMLELSVEFGDEEEQAIVERQLTNLDAKLKSLEVQQLLSGEFDSRSAILSIRSGAGGDDATDFSEMLMRMYSRFSEEAGFKTQVLSLSVSQGAGIKSCSMRIDGPFAYGKLASESGTHRLVRMSPFNAAGKRQTSFAAVEVVPLFEDSDEIEISDAEIRVDVFRSSGPGGQSVNTTDSAVRITHLPSGLVVSCQNEKSQLQNKTEALRVLKSRLLEIRRTESETKKRELAGSATANWGDQIRSYVLAPYQMVKDHRTGTEDNSPADVLDGKLNEFIAAGIRWRASQNPHGVSNATENA